MLLMQRIWDLVPSAFGSQREDTKTAGDLPSRSSGNLTAGNECEFNESPETATGDLNNPHETRMEFIIAMLIKIKVFWVITDCITVNHYRRFGRRAVPIFRISQLNCYYI